jgi:hypothetical protein
MSTYFAILTEVGEAKLANAIALGQTLKLKNLAVGDGNGNLPMPVRTQKALVREVRRAGLNQLTIDPANTSQIIVEQVLPEDVGGWWIREIGIYDEAGDLCAVANCPPSYKPLMAEGSGRTQVVRIVLIVASTAAIELKIDPSVILATRKYVDDQDIVVRAYSDEKLAKHLAADDPHPLLAKRSHMDQQDKAVMGYADAQLDKHLAADDPHPLLAKRSHMDQQDKAVMGYADAQLAKHLDAADPHPLLAKRTHMDQQDKAVMDYADMQLDKHLAADDPHPLLAKRSHMDQQDKAVMGYADAQLDKHLAADDPHPLLAKRSHMDQQDKAIIAYADAELAKHAAAPDPHPQYSMKEVATLPRFDASLKVVNAAFVQQAQGNIISHDAVGYSRNLAADDIGKALYFSAPNLIFTLPKPSDLGLQTNSGKCIHFFGFGGNTAKIVPGAGANISFTVGGVPFIEFKTGQYLTLTAASDITWQVIDSTAELWRNADFASRLSPDGYQTLPGGVILQWQIIDVPVAASDFATKNFSFPIAFKEAVFGCTASVVGIGASANSNAFVSAMPTSVNGGVAQNNYINSNVSVFIVSIGK